MTSDRLAFSPRDGFQAALQEARLEAGDEIASKSHRLHTLNHVPDFWNQETCVPCALARAYEDGNPDSTADSVIDDVTVDAIARELNLDASKSIADLLRVRRAFALRNHPDLLPQEERGQATERMALANFLIDQEIRTRTIEAKNLRNSGTR
jgi:hypothetical protein